MSEVNNIVCGSLFEDDYLIRTIHGSLIHQPDVALTELVANAWDAGATKVSIFIPDKIGDTLTVKDNGIGLSETEFKERWMKLAYNKLAHQGKAVYFVDGSKSTRKAYGRNGIGRHGLLCFNDEYNVLTIKEGVQCNFQISTKASDISNQPIAIINEDNHSASQPSGTELSVAVERNLPNIEKIREIISSRFLHDPAFKIEINRVELSLDQLSGLIDTQDIEIAEGICVSVNFIDTKKAAHKSMFQGVAFWQDGRLVGTPSWVLGNEYYVDGRTVMARKYTIVVQSSSLEEYIKSDWTGFIDHEIVNTLYKKVGEYADKMFKQIASNNIEETKASVRTEFKNKLANASPLVIYEVNEVIETIHLNFPTASKESMMVAVEAIINLEATTNGQELLSKLADLNEEDIAGLNKLLNKWSIKDALIVLEEIHRRISVIEAIRKLSVDSDVDELHILHPLVSESRWLFGPEYDTPEYTSNRQIQTVVKSLFKGKLNEDLKSSINKRPDVVVLADNSFISITGTDEYNTETQLNDVAKVLIIELKKGGFNIKSKERYQATEYIEEFIKQGFDNTKFNAFVVGHSVEKGLLRKSTVGDNGYIYVTTFSQLVDSAERRMYGLREKLSSMYDDVPGMELYQQTKLSL